MISLLLVCFYFLILADFTVPPFMPVSELTVDRLWLCTPNFNYEILCYRTMA